MRVGSSNDSLVTVSGETYRAMAIVVCIRGESMTPGQREGRRWRQSGAVAVAAAGVVVITVIIVVATVAVAGQHHVPELLLDVVKGVLLHLDVARAVRENERGRAQLESSRTKAARVGWRDGGGRIHIAT